MEIEVEDIKINLKIKFSLPKKRKHQNHKLN